MTPMPGSFVSTRCEFLVGLARAVGDDHHAGVERVADADAAAVMHGHPRRARRRVEQRIQHGPVGDRVAAVAHAFRLAVGRRDRSGVEMIAADHDRRADCAACARDRSAPARTARARPGRARKCAPAVPGTPRARSPSGSSGTAARRPRTSRARVDRSRGCRRDRRTAPPTGTGPCLRRTAGARTRARTRECRTRSRRRPAAPARGCCCRSRTSRRRAPAARASPATCAAIAFIDRRMYSSGRDSRRRAASASVMPFGT